MYDAIQVVGWAGTVLLLVTYALSTCGKLTAFGSTHLAINVGAPLVIAISTAALHEWPLTSLNATRLAIGLIPVAQAMRERRAQSRDRNASGQRRVEVG